MFYKLKEIIINRSFALGIVLTVGILSTYIFGDDNLLEQIAEAFIKEETGQEVDFSPAEVKDADITTRH